MRITIHGEDFEVRVQERKVTFCDIMKSGKLISMGAAIPNPMDEELGNVSLEIGEKIAIGRALSRLNGYATDNGRPFEVKPILKRIQNKLRLRRLKKNLTLVEDLLSVVSQQFNPSTARVGTIQPRAGTIGPWLDLDSRAKNTLEMSPMAEPKMFPADVGYVHAVHMVPKPRFLAGLTGLSTAAMVAAARFLSYIHSPRRG